MACPCCNQCVSDQQCEEDFNLDKCCGGVCTSLGCCVVSIETSCLAICYYGCQVIVGGPNNGKYNCYQNPCNPFP